MLNEFIRMEIYPIGLVPLKKKRQKECACTEKMPVRTQKEGNPFKPRKEALGEIKLANTLILELHSLKL